jgi:hypothetical protein
VAVPVAEGVTDRLPLVASEPLQLPLAVQEVALVEDQLSVVLPPSVSVVGLAEIVAVGASAFAVTVAFAAAVVLSDPAQISV